MPASNTPLRLIPGLEKTVVFNRASQIRTARMGSPTPISHPCPPCWRQNRVSQGLLPASVRRAPPNPLLGGFNEAFPVTQQRSLQRQPAHNSARHLQG